MKATPVKGTNDYLPREVRLRNYLQGEIVRTYQSCGFERIQTPILEDIENLDKSEGGENLGLIFKVLKRGDKFQKAIEDGQFQALADLGLRYDLTLPLARYYANNRAHLPNPFKCIQTDQVFRAERPQKGRLREFVQCDIDIIGTDSVNAEIELIYVTAQALLNININNFIIKINDKRILKDILLSAGFEEEHLDSVCITFDKLAKIQVQGVLDELKEKEFSPEAISKFADIIKGGRLSLEDAKAYCSNPSCVENLEYIMKQSELLSDGKYQLVFDSSLVRGQGYYTGTVFEIESPEFGSSIGGGGRYDNMVGKFLNENIPAVGFSIGFERIVSILLTREYEIPALKKRAAVIYDKEKIQAAMAFAGKKRAEYDVALFERAKKVGKQLNQLTSQGYDRAYILNEEIEEKVLKQ